MVNVILSIVTVKKNCAATIDITLDSICAVKQPGVECVKVDGVSGDATLSAILA